MVDAVNRSRSIPLFKLLGVVDSSPSRSNLELLGQMGVPWLGGEAEWLESAPRANFLIGVGSPGVRERIARLFGDAGLTAATVIHPSATVGSLSTIAAGSVVCAGVQISTNVSLGRHVHINPSATIGHDSIVGDFVSINPGAIVSGNVTVGTGALIGAGAVVLQGLAVGQQSVVGASACVVRSVAPSATVKGVPAR